MKRVVLSFTEYWNCLKSKEEEEDRCLSVRAFMGGVMKINECALFGLFIETSTRNLIRINCYNLSGAYHFHLLYLPQMQMTSEECIDCSTCWIITIPSDYQWNYENHDHGR